MKPSEQFFKIPVRYYSAFDVRRASKMEELTDDIGDLPFVEGWVAIDVYEVIGWEDSFYRDSSIDDIIENGFSSTKVYLNNGLEYVCTWDRCKFERKYDNFIERLDIFYNKEVKDVIS